MNSEGVDALFAPAVRRGSRNATPSLKGNAAHSLSPTTPKTPLPRKGPTAEDLSKQYMDTNKLDYNDRIEDGFCDYAADKVIVDRGEDHNFDSFLQRAQKKLQKAADPITELMVLALIISEFSGRSGAQVKGLQNRLAARLQECKRSNGTILLGSLLGEQTGKKKDKVQGCCLARHRALVFKAAADYLGISKCQLERDNARIVAWNIVSVNQAEYIVDLMHDPGALYEAGTPKHDEYIRFLSPALTESLHNTTISMREELQGSVPRPPWHVEASELVMGKGKEDLLGKGGFGEVFKATWAGVIVAIKVVKDKEPSDYDVLNFILEIALLSRLNHPNVMRFWRGCAQIENGRRCLLMVTEYIEKGGLSTLLHGHGGPKLPEALTIPQIILLSLGISRGMQYLHACNVLHLDLKSPNVLVDISWVPKLCDFGLAKISNKELGEGFETTLRGVSPIWAPPEMFDDQAEGMTEKADVYSFGIVFFEVATRQLPFQEINQRNLPKAKWEGVLPQVPKDVPDDFRKLITDCCAHRPSTRPSMSGCTARITQLAQSRGINLSEVVMPSWNGPQGPAKEEDILQQLQAQRAELTQERQRLVAQLEKIQKQRRKVEETHLGKTGVEAKPLLAAKDQGPPQSSAPPRSAPLPKEDSISPDRGANGKAKQEVQTTEPKKNGCCSIT